MGDKKYIPLSVCNYCGNDYGYNTPNSTEKVISDCYANMLCAACRSKMETEIREIAKKYLKTK